VVTSDNATVYFAVGAATLPDDAAKTLDPVINKLKLNAGTKALISGYHSATGELATNQELAKNRAMAVHGALKAAGIAEDRLMLDKPLVAEANLAGEDPKARRVEVAVK
jgi:outer membrane protein OmpA-like peptidoglycan-associated protein